MVAAGDADEESPVVGAPAEVEGPTRRSQADANASASAKRTSPGA